MGTDSSFQTAVDAKGGFIEHHEQYEEIYQSKHLALACVDCHNPHTLVVQNRQADAATVRTTCENCHFQEARFQKVEVHQNIDVTCESCHMPRMVKNAQGNAEMFTGDIRVHLMAINPYQVDMVYTTPGFSDLDQAVRMLEL